MAASIEEERQMREFQMNQMKQNWAETAAQKKAERNKAPEPDWDLTKAGAASLQKMSGEDTNRVERIAKQKEQMKVWIQQQIAEKQYVRQLESEEDLNYGDMVKAIDEIREATDKEESEMRKYIIDRVKAENLEVCKIYVTCLFHLSVCQLMVVL